MKIIVAEDDLLINELIVEWLEDAGFKVLPVKDGRSAIEIINSADEIDLLITDLRMPGATGLEIAKLVATNRPQLPVLFCSAHPDMLAGLPSGIPCHLLPKPFACEELLATVFAMLRENALSAGAIAVDDGPFANAKPSTSSSSASAPPGSW